MKIKGKGIVQLGLHKQAEFIHYVGAKRKHYSKDAPIDMLYLGFDCDSASIAYMIQEYGDISDANFLCSGIGEEGIKETVGVHTKDHFCQRALDCRTSSIKLRLMPYLF